MKSPKFLRIGLIGTILAIFLVGLVDESYAGRGYGSYNTYRSTNTGYRSYQPAARTPSYTRPTQQRSPGTYTKTTPGGGVSRSGNSAPRAMPKSISSTSPVSRTPAFKGQVTKAGSPIIASKSGKKFAIPQQGVVSTKSALMSGASRTALSARLSASDIGKLKNRFNAVAHRGKSIDGKVNQTAAKKGNSEPTKLDKAPDGYIRSSSQKIAGGHAFDKHILQQGEFVGSIKTREQFAKHIEKVMTNPTAKKQLAKGRSAYWDESTRTVVIADPSNPDGGTAFQPANGRSFYDDLR